MEINVVCFSVWYSRNFKTKKTKIQNKSKY